MQKLVRAQTKHTQFLYDLYCDRSVQQGHGVHSSIPGKHWRDVILGAHEGYQHVYVIMLGVLPVGHAAFHGYSSEDRRAEVTYSVLPSMRRRGIATNALADLMELATLPLREGGLALSCTWAATPSYNVGSIAVLRSAGFVQTGEIPNYYRYSGGRHARLIFTWNGKK